MKASLRKVSSFLALQWLSACPINWPQRLTLTQNWPAASLFVLPDFDDDTEQQFWQKCLVETQTFLKAVLAMTIGAFFVFLLNDLAHRLLSTEEWVIRLALFLILFAQLRVVSAYRLSRHQLKNVTKLIVGCSVLELFGLQLIGGDVKSYSDTWVWLLPIYFFNYGQLLLSVREALAIGLSATLLLPIAALAAGVSEGSLLSSIIVLAVSNAFGCYLRWQLELQARSLFLEQRKAEAATHNKTRFLRQLSHNLRQPLQALSCYASVLETAYIDKPAEPLLALVGRMGTAIDELSNSFNRILEIANLETGQQAPFITSTDINVLLSTLEFQYAPLAAKRGLKLKINLRQKPPFNVQTDPCILGQIIGNLLDNAIKYTPAGWILMQAVAIGGNRLKLHICDTGIGIRSEQLQHIFQEFYRGQRRSTESPPPGMGIGLAYVTNAIQHLPKHSLDVCSRPGQGSDFRLMLPIAETAHDNDGTGDTRSDTLAGTFVLIVENETELLDALAEQISAWGCLVQKARSIADIQMLLTDQLMAPDLLITDFYLDDGTTAHDVIQLIKTEYGPTPTLVLSGHAIADKDKLKCSANVAILRKPAGSSRLRQAMADCLGRI